MTNIKNLYALLVGINNYESVPKLKACVSDVEQVNEYLKNWANKEQINYCPLLLTNDNAKRHSIINGFRQHLCKAKADDLVVFYFSGHGGQEDAAKVFLDVEYDKKLETIVAQDSRNPHGVSDIADKELRYLIREVAQNEPHILTIFDCCHAGTNTRHPVKRLSGYTTERNWSQFIFSDKYKTEQDFVNAGGTNKALPEGNHIQIAACEDLELAYEYQGSGIFTKALLQVLTDTKGAVSYYALRNRLKYSINKFSSFTQSPQIYVKGDQAAIFENFLLGSDTTPKQSVNIIYNTKLKRWIVDVGAVHGLNIKDFSVEIYENEKCIAKASAAVIHFGYALLKFEEGQSNLDIRKQYNGSMEYLFVANTRIHLNIKTPTLQQKVIDFFIEKKEKVEWTNAEEAHFAFFEKNNQLLITYPNDDKPLVKPLEQHSLKRLLTYYKYISKWQFVKTISPIRQIRRNPIDIQFHRNNALLQPKDGILTLEYDKLPPNAHPSNAVPKGNFTIHITNKHRYPLYFALVGLDEQFGIYTKILDKPMVRLKNEERIEYTFKLDYQPYLHFHKWKHSTIFLKILAVPNEADISLLAQNALPNPLEDKLRQIKRRNNKALRPEEWFTQLVEVRVVNPFQ